MLQSAEQVCQHSMLSLTETVICDTVSLQTLQSGSWLVT